MKKNNVYNQRAFATIARIRDARSVE